MNASTTVAEDSVSLASGGVSRLHTSSSLRERRNRRWIACCWLCNPRIPSLNNCNVGIILRKREIEIKNLDTTKNTV
jgi:hypothetical protein